MKEFRFIFLRLCLYLITGILSAFWFRVDSSIILFLSSVILLFYFIIFFRGQKEIFQGASIGIISFIMVFCLGYNLTHFKIPEFQPSHYSNFDLPANSILQAEVSEELKKTSVYDRYIIKTKSIYQEELQKTEGKLLLNIKADTAGSNFLKPGDIILLPFKPEAFNPPLNPFQFDYGNYMKNLQVEKQITLDPGQIEVTGHHPSLFAFAQNLREKIISDLKNYQLGKEELAVFQTLILGQKRDISPELYKSYASAGALHILAISGLHIGILLLFLNFVFRPVLKLKGGRIIKTILLILLLWGFALLTGLNPSVVRAVGMFSFIAVGMQFKRKTSVLNGLFLSLFFLLLINPYYLFQVGFQLSYLAVFSIIIFQTFIYRVFTFKFKLMDYFWKLISVSLAAQIGILPLSIFYFHQFPGLFLISNLFILPFLGIILGLGIAIIILSQINFLPEFITDVFGKLLAWMNYIVVEIGSLDQFVISGLSLSKIQLLAAYAFIISLILLLKFPGFKRISYLLISIIIFQLASLWNVLNIPGNQLVIFHKTGKTIIAEKKGLGATFYSDSSVTPIVTDWQREYRITKIQQDSIPRVLQANDKILFVVDSVIPIAKFKIKPDYLLLKNSPRINLERLLDSIQPDIVIVDGSNYASYVKVWKQTAETKKIPFHYTGEKGAFILNEGF
ncbi:ComEC/Rec2 family competence protein [Christiangramia aquimixticola]|uniref:ComEC/Rec2 family competence protein n=1 Tax=Christiangramia aquimixticola TaxID=1697558 RepID=UPI003AA8AFAE